MVFQEATMEEYYGYCIKCRSRKRLENPINHKQRNPKTKNKQVNMVKGRCPGCNGIIYVVIGHD